MTNTKLHEYLHAIKDLEDELIELKPEDLEIVFDGLKEKIDGYVELLQYMDERAEAIKAKAKKLQEQAKYLENSQRRIKEYIGFLLNSHETPELKGNFYKVKVRKHQKVVTVHEPTDELAGRYPELIRQKIEYQWDKTNLKEVLKNDPKALDFALLSETITIQARVNK